MAARALIALKFIALLLFVPAVPLAQPADVTEQEIWTAPLGQSPEQQIWPGPEEQAAGGDPAVASDILGICVGGQTLAPAVEEACATALGRLVAAEADRRLRAIEAEAAAREARRALDDRNNAHTVGVLEQQLLQTQVMFWVSIGVVLLGVTAAGLQFYLAFSGRERSEIDLVIQKDQFRVKTAWIGVVLFAMSIALLVGYLHFVFEITAIE